MKQRKISRVNTPARLFAKDEEHIRTKVKINGITDTRFKDNSSAIRYYVQNGIDYEKRIQSSNTLDSTIIKSSQKEVITETLKPVKSSVDDLINVMKDFGKKQEEHFTESLKLSERLARRFEATNEQHESNYAELMKEFLIGGKINEEALRNAIVLRSILSVFLLAYKTGRIIPSDKTNWNKVVFFIIQKAQELSIMEIQQLTSGNKEDKAVEILTQELWEYIKINSPKVDPSNKQQVID